MSLRRLTALVLWLGAISTIVWSASDRWSERVYSERLLSRQQMLGIVWRAVVFTLDDVYAKVVSCTFDAKRIRMTAGDGLGTGVSEHERLDAAIADLETLGDVRLEITVRPTLHDVDASRGAREQASAVTLHLDIDISADLDAKGVERDVRRLEKLFYTTLDERVRQLVYDATAPGAGRWRTPPYQGIPTPPIWGPGQPTPPWDGS